jgi:hypothetical protein
MIRIIENPYQWRKSATQAQATKTKNINPATKALGLATKALKTSLYTHLHDACLINIRKFIFLKPSTTCNQNYSSLFF